MLDHELVKYLAKRGTDVYLMKESDWSWSKICASQNQTAFAAFLIARQSQQERVRRVPTVEISKGDVDFARRAQVSQVIRYRIALVLLRANANVNLSTKYDNSTLHAAVLKVLFPVCRVLIEDNADTNKDDRILKLNSKSRLSSRDGSISLLSDNFVNNRV